MKPMVSDGEAHISSMVAAYEVGTLTTNSRPVAALRASAITWPPVVITLASTEGTNSALIGCAAVPISAMAVAAASGVAVGGTAVLVGGGRGVLVGWGGSVGATVVPAGPQAESTRAVSIVTANSW